MGRELLGMTNKLKSKMNEFIGKEILMVERIIFEC